MFAPKRILVPTDFSADSDRALKEALDIARAFHSKVFLIHVDRRIQGPAAEVPLTPLELEEIEKEQTWVAKAKMIEEIHRIMEQWDVYVEIAERHGRTHLEILHYAAEKEIDLIVIEPHARRGLLKTLVGGVSDHVSRRAPCPVLVLH